jgi:peptidyl-prolyl cis-trans isomerase SurA
MKLRRTLFACTLVGCLAAGPGSAQEPVIPMSADSLQLIDQIVAIVGDTAILRSELYQEFFRMQSQGATLPAEGSEEWNRLALQVVSAAADRLLILQQAKRSDIIISDQDVDAFAEQNFQELRGNFNSDAEMQAAVEQSGMNLLQYRQMLSAEARAELLIQQYRGRLEAEGNLPPVVVTEEEIVAYFDEAAASETRPATVTFNQLLVRPLPSPEARDSALAIAERAIVELADGEEFAVVARRYSQDLGTRDTGGELGWMRRGDLVKSFADAAWGGRPGRVIGPVASRFGYHLIKVENTRGGERFIRHILIVPRISEEDIATARTRATEFADSLRAGVDPERVANHPAVLDEQIRFDEVVVQALAERFGPEYPQRVAAVEPGTVLEPFPIQAPGGGTEFVVLEVITYRASGPYVLDDVRDQIRTRIKQQKQLEAYIEELRQNAFIKIIM